MKRTSDKGAPHPERDKLQGNPRGRGIRPTESPESARAEAAARNDGGVLKRKAAPSGGRKVRGSSGARAARTRREAASGSGKAAAAPRSGKSGPPATSGKSRSS
jgi:hypothetical protein